MDNNNNNNLNSIFNTTPEEEKARRENLHAFLVEVLKIKLETDPSETINSTIGDLFIKRNSILQQISEKDKLAIINHIVANEQNIKLDFSNLSEEQKMELVNVALKIKIEDKVDFNNLSKDEKLAYINKVIYENDDTINFNGIPNPESNKINWKDALRKYILNSSLQPTEEEGVIPWYLDKKELGLSPLDVPLIFEDRSATISPEMLTDFLKEAKDLKDNGTASGPTVILDSKHITEGIDFLGIPKPESNSEKQDVILFNNGDANKWVKASKTDDKDKEIIMGFENCNFPEQPNLNSFNLSSNTYKIVSDGTESVPEGSNKTFLEQVQKIRDDANPTVPKDNKNKPQ